MKLLRGRNKMQKKGEIELLHKGKQQFYLDQNSLGHGSTEQMFFSMEKHWRRNSNPRRIIRRIQESALSLSIRWQNNLYNTANGFHRWELNKKKKAYTDTAWNFLHFESTVHGIRYRKDWWPSQGRGSIRKNLPI